MAEIALFAEVRSAEGTRAARRQRGAGRIPGVLYGHGVTPTTLSVDARELRSALTTEAGTNAIFELHLDGSTHLAITREVQRHPVRQRITHVDFQVVDRNELVPGDVPVHLLGEAIIVTREGGNVDHLVVQIPVHARPGEMPNAFELDISGLEFGSQLKVSDLVVPDGVTVNLDPETVLVIAHAPRGVELEETESTEETSPDAVGASSDVDSESAES